MKRWVLPILLATVLLSGCMEDPLKSVKKTVLTQFDQTIPVGVALERYTTCVPKSQHWKISKLDNGESLVEFSCVDEEFPTFMQTQIKRLLEVFRNHPIIPESATKDIDSFVNWANWMLEFGRVLFGHAGIEAQIPEIDQLKSLDIAKSTFKVQFSKNPTTNQYEPKFVGYDVTYSDATRSTVKMPNFVLQACYRNQPIMKAVEDYKHDISKELVHAYKSISKVPKKAAQ